MLATKKLVGTYRNYEIKVVLKLYQVKANGMNKPELRDSYKDILDKMDPPPPYKKWTAKY